MIERREIGSALLVDSLQRIAYVAGVLCQQCLHLLALLSECTSLAFCLRGEQVAYLLNSLAMLCQGSLNLLKAALRLPLLVREGFSEIVAKSVKLVLAVVNKGHQ